MSENIQTHGSTVGASYIQSVDVIDPVSGGTVSVGLYLDPVSRGVFGVDDSFPGSMEECDDMDVVAFSPFDGTPIHLMHGDGCEEQTPPSAKCAGHTAQALVKSTLREMMGEILDGADYDTERAILSGDMATAKEALRRALAVDDAHAYPSMTDVFVGAGLLFIDDDDIGELGSLIRVLQSSDSSTSDGI